MSRTATKQKPKTQPELQAEIDELSARVEELIDKRDYVQAEKENKKLEELQRQLTEMQRSETISQQQQKKTELKKAYEKITEEFKEKWDEEMREFEHECENQLTELTVYSSLIYLLLFTANILGASRQRDGSTSGSTRFTRQTSFSAINPVNFSSKYRNTTSKNEEVCYFLSKIVCILVDFCSLGSKKPSKRSVPLMN